VVAQGVSESQQQVGVGPQNQAVDPLYGLQHVVVIVPVDRHIQEAEQVTEEYRRHPGECRPVGAGRHLQFEHHDRNDDGDHPIAESGQPFHVHEAPALAGSIRRYDGA
jgi:hypothetical protein